MCKNSIQKTGFCRLKPPTAWLILSYVAALALLAGCRPAVEVNLEKKPRPVAVKTLVRSQLDSNALTTANVASWKTESIGFEVSGRIETVVEPNTDIEGRVKDSEGNLLFAGTPIASINKERYQLQVESQTAQVSRAKQAIEAAKIQLEKSIPAQILAAEAEKKRAETEYLRSKRLVARNAGAQADVDRDEAGYNTALSQIEQLNASKKAQEAELQSLNAQRLQAEDALRDAQRNLENCTLYSSFRGQISDVSVVPGSVVTAGAPVATIQMMDPIKIELEVSAEDSRRLRNRQRLAVQLTRPDGSTEEKDGYLYLVDPVADPQTRTFTLTLLMMNERLTDELKRPGVPTADQTWRVDFEFLPGAKKGIYYASEDSILQDESGYFVWHITNMDIHGDLPADRLLNVRKARIELGPRKIPFLGNWIFQQIVIVDDQFDPAKNVIVGKLRLPDGSPVAPTEWDGEQVLYQNEGQWLLRPGDLVKVNLADNVQNSGLFVPMDAIGYELEKTFVFLLNEEQATVERVEVRVADVGSKATSQFVAVEPVDSSVRLEGRKFVIRGAHYLIDGEKVRPVESELSP